MQTETQEAQTQTLHWHPRPSCRWAHNRRSCPRDGKHSQLIDPPTASWTEGRTGRYTVSPPVLRPPQRDLVLQGKRETARRGWVSGSRGTRPWEELELLLLRSEVSGPCQLLSRPEELLRVGAGSLVPRRFGRSHSGLADEMASTGFCASQQSRAQH